jgi:hypothetical protein
VPDPSSVALSAQGGFVVEVAEMLALKGRQGAWSIASDVVIAAS